MSFEPRDSPGRRRTLIEGRARVAVLVAGAYVLGAASGVGVPALAGAPAPGSAAAACADPARTTPKVTVEGQEIDCAALGLGGTPAAEVPPADKPAPTPPTSAPAAAPAGPPADVPAAPPATPAPGTGTPAVKTPAAQAPGASISTPSSTKSKPAPAAAPQRDDGAVAEAKALAEVKAKAKVKTRVENKAGAKREAKALAKAKAKALAKVRAKARAKAKAKAKKGDDEAARTYASLPSEWTSLTPLELPAFSVEGFPIPPFLLPIYQAAAAEYGVPWEVLASINEIETDFGRNATVSSAGALGWMQFIYSSWTRWGTDGDEDGKRDPRNPVDAIFAAARYLDDAGAGTDLPKAIFAYNHADWYVNKVVERAREFAGLDRTLVAALSERALREDLQLYRAQGNPFAGRGAVKPSPGQVLLLSKKQLVRMVLKSEDITVYPGGRKDIAAGRINRRVLQTLVFLDRSGLNPTVSSLTTGHSRFTSGGNISAHSYGHAVDISAINGTSIAGNQGVGTVTAKALKRLVQLQGYGRPNQIISLMTIADRENTLAMSDHADHIHVGFPRVPQVKNVDRPQDITKIVAAFRAKK